MSSRRRRGGDAAQLAQGLLLGGDVLEHVGGGDQVEALVLEGQLLQARPAATRVEAALAGRSRRPPAEGSTPAASPICA